MKSKENALKEAAKDSRLAGPGCRFDAAADLRQLREQYPRQSKRAFLQLLDALIEKYEVEETAAVHAALVEKARGGDLAAIRLYRESQAEAGSKGGVVIIDDI